MFEDVGFDAECGGDPAFFAGHAFIEASIFGRIFQREEASIEFVGIHGPRSGIAARAFADEAVERFPWRGGEILRVLEAVDAGVKEFL